MTANSFFRRLSLTFATLAGMALLWGFLAGGGPPFFYAAIGLIIAAALSFGAAIICVIWETDEFD